MLDVRETTSVFTPMQTSVIQDASIESATIENISLENSNFKRPKLIWINALLSAVIMVAIILEWLPAAVLFMSRYCFSAPY